MSGEEIVNVEVTIGVPPSRDAIGIFLHHPDPDGRVEAETVVHANGGEYTTYPVGQLPGMTPDGYAAVRGANLYVSVGPMYIIAPMTVKPGEVSDIVRAVVYITDKPFDAADTTEKTWLAVHLPLVHKKEDEG